MATSAQTSALISARDAARASSHIFPEIAACEVMVESSWGTSHLYLLANNPFGEKQSVDAPVFETINLPTWEVVDGAKETCSADFVDFPSLADAYTQRMALLQRLAPEYPEYAAALDAATPEEFVTEVSKRWSTDPNRAATVISIFHAHAALFD